MWIDSFLQDLRHGWRVFAGSPGFSAIAVLSIACGTGANVAMFSAVDAILLRPLPVRDANALITIGSRPDGGSPYINVASYPDFVDIRARNRSFSALVAFSTRRAGVSLSSSGSRHVRLVTSASGNFFDEFGIGMHLGRGFLADEDLVPGRDAVAVLSFGVWRQLFDGDPSAVGRQFVIAGTTFTVVGVTEESFTGVDADIATQAIYVPLAMLEQIMNVPGREPLSARDLRVLTVKGRLRRGVSLADARAELDVIGRNLERAHPDTNARQRIVAQSELQFRMAQTPVRAGVAVLVSILSLSVLFVACANVAGLLTSRAPLRARELAVRLAIGAGRARLVTQLLTESLLIACAGGLAGLGVGYAGIRLIGRIQFPTDIVAAPVIGLDVRTLVFSLAMAMGSAVVFGFGPALAATRIDLANSFRATDPAARRRWRIGGRSQLVALQVALSLVVLTVAAIALQTFAATFGAGPGFRTTRMAKLSIDASQARYAGARAVEFFERVTEQARLLPGVTSVGVTSAMPLWEAELVPTLPDGAPLPQGRVGVQVWTNVVDEGYFTTMEIPLAAGRTFLATDDASAAPVAIVNETMAARHWPDQNPLGRRFRLHGESGPLVEVVGVARNSMYHFPGEAPSSMLYLPHRQQPRANMVLLVQTAGPSAEPLPAMRALVSALDPGVPVYDAQTIERFYDALAVSLASVVLSMIGGIGVMGVVITVIGLYALVSYAATRRTREIGIRIAVGATYGRVLRLLLRQGLTPVWVGLGVGLLLAGATTRLLPTLVPFSKAYDGRALYGLVPVLLSVTLLAAFLPARRAARVNPMVALRDE